MKTLFVAGTDTGVGKTIIAGALAGALRLRGHRVGVMKPVACGSWDDSRYLRRLAGVSDDLHSITPVYFERPLSPNVAARFEKKTVDVKTIMRLYETLKKKYDILVVEGCGGLLVPIMDRFFVVDLISRMKADCVLDRKSVV